MSRLLVSALGIINSIVALILVLSGAGLGKILLAAYGPNARGDIIGGILGGVVAAIFCGGLAALLLIESHLRLIANDVRQHQRVEASRAKAARNAAKAEAATAKAAVKAEAAAAKAAAKASPVARLGAGTAVQTDMECFAICAVRPCFRTRDRPRGI
ncbi:hypothetical protein [Mesorhizobium sp. SARCC-RB16n]|uniref:hypothetical protein n=1 Tax=Mesorhizobium sp. SARCC-RB16n TaxID=2116687 RepID=UPI00122F6544|nr:hypothetical protein [Mesorhizobium sp. SARCC-RB16n]